MLHKTFFRQPRPTIHICWPKPIFPNYFTVFNMNIGFRRCNFPFRKRSLPSQTVFAIPDQVASWELASSRHAVHESSSCFSSKPKVENCLLKIMAASNGEALQSLKRTTGWNEFYREVAVSALILCFYLLIC